MTDDAGFLRAICEDPFDDAVRLIYADWLNDQGRYGEERQLRREVSCPLRRAFVCTNDALDNTPDGDFKRVMEHLGSMGVHSGWASRGFVDGVRCPFRDWFLNGPLLCKKHTLTGVGCAHPSMWGQWITRGPSGLWAYDYSTVQDTIVIDCRLRTTPGMIEQYFEFIQSLRYETAMKVYHLPSESERDFNIAALNYARRMAGLPRLTLPLPASV